MEIEICPQCDKKLSNCICKHIDAFNTLNEGIAATTNISLGKLIEYPDDTGFMKFDSKKPILSFPLGMWRAMGAIAKVMTYGAVKYAKDNWRKAEGDDIERYLDATIRHISQHCSGEIIDEESGNAHIHHALTSLAMYVELKDLGENNES